MIWNITMLFLFGISMIGYTIYIQKKLNIRIEFIPLITISMITVVLFIGGILNILPLTVNMLFILGILLFIFESFINLKARSTKKKMIEFITPGTILFMIFSIYFLFMLKDQRLIHYDNFSHWGLIVKNMLDSNSLPNFENTTIRFNSYPPGSALFIYYFCFFVGKSEGLALFAQLLIILSSLLTLFSFSSFSVLNISKNENSILKNVFLNIITIFASLYLLNGPTSIHQLLVDTLISVVGIAIFAMIYYYFNFPHKIFFPLIFLTLFLTLIKNSGMFFSILALVVYSVSLYKHGKKEYKSVISLFKKNKYLLLPICLPFLGYYLWTKHVSMVFSSNLLGKHTMSFENYINNFNDKTINEVKKIIHIFIETLLTSEFTRQIILITLMIVSLILLKRLSKQIYDKRLVTVSVGVLFIFISYSSGLLLMYLISMPLGEALKLAAFDRYMSTVMHYLMGITIVTLIFSLKQLNSKVIFLVPSGVVLIVLFSLTFRGENYDQSKSIFQNVDIKNDSTTLTFNDIDRALTNISPNQLISKGNEKPYLIYYPIGNDNDNYVNYYLRYRLFQNNVIYVTNLEDMDEKIWQSDFLVITIVNDEIETLFEKYSDENVQIGTYELDKKNQKILNKTLY